MNQSIEDLKHIPLSDHDIKRMCDGKVKVIMYSDLKKYKTLDQLLKPYGSVIILYRTGENYGHWCCLNKINKNTVEFFDPYGNMVDLDLKWTDEKTRKQLGQDLPLLSKLMYDSPYRLDYNHHKFQNIKDASLATCGRWCVLRILLKDLTLKQFSKIFLKKKKSPDSIVTELSANL